MYETFERWTKDKIKVKRREIFINLIEMKFERLSKRLKEQLNEFSDKVFG